MTRSVATRDRRRDGMGAIDAVSAAELTSTDLVMSADTDMESDSASTNFGNATTFAVGESNAGVRISRGLLKPDFSTIPAGRLFATAILKITPTADFSSNARTLRVYRCLRNWLELQATWNEYSTGNAWGTAGCGNNVTDYYGTAELGNVAVLANPVIGTPIPITLTASEIQKMYDGTYNNYGLFLKVDTETDDSTVYASRTHATVGYRPILTIEHD